MTSAYTITTPVFEPLPKLPQPDWSYLQNQLSDTYQSHEALQHENAKLTKSLCHSQVIIRAQEAREEACEAQIVVQNAHLIKLNDSLHAKENKKKNDPTALFVDGFGRHLTDAEFTSQLRAQNERQAVEAAEKEQRQAGQKTKKAAKEALEAEWKRMLGDHQEAIEAWKAECDRIKAQNVRAKDLPKKPKHPLKPKPAVEDVGGSRDASDDSSSDE